VLGTIVLFVLMRQGKGGGASTNAFVLIRQEPCLWKFPPKGNSTRITILPPPHGAAQPTTSESESALNSKGCALYSKDVQRCFASSPHRRVGRQLPRPLRAMPHKVVESVRRNALRPRSGSSAVTSWDQQHGRFSASRPPPSDSSSSVSPEHNSRFIVCSQVRPSSDSGSPVSPEHPLRSSTRSPVSPQSLSGSPVSSEHIPRSSICSPVKRVARRMSRGQRFAVLSPAFPS